MDLTNAGAFVDTFDSESSFTLSAPEFEMLGRRVVDKAQSHVLAETGLRRLAGTCSRCGRPWLVLGVCDQCRAALDASQS